MAAIDGKKRRMADDFLAEKIRAEDILLGSLGYGESASIISIEKTTSGYHGLGKWDDDEQFQFPHDAAVARALDVVGPY